MLADKAIWCSRKRKMIPIGLCGRFGPDIICHSGLHLGTFLLRCTLFWLFQVCAGLWRDDAVNTSAVCLLFHSVQLDQLSERNQHWYLCQWFLSSASLAFRLSAGNVLGTWVASLQRRSSVTSIRPLATEVLLHIFHRWIALFAPTCWLLVVPLSNDRWQRSLKRRTRYPTTYSTGLLVCHLQLMLLLWQDFLPASLVADQLRPSWSVISQLMVQFCLVTS